MAEADRVTGVPAAFAEGLDLIRRGGRYLVMGNLSPGRTVPFDPGYVTRKALTIEHVDRYEARYLSKALDFLQRHQSASPFDKLVDAEFALADVKGHSTPPRNVKSHARRSPSPRHRRTPTA